MSFSNGTSSQCHQKAAASILGIPAAHVTCRASWRVFTDFGSEGWGFESL